MRSLASWNRLFVFTPATYTEVICHSLWACVCKIQNCICFPCEQEIAVHTCIKRHRAVGTTPLQTTVIHILVSYTNIRTQAHKHPVPKLSHTVRTCEIQPCTHVNSFSALPDCSSFTSPHGSQGRALNDSIIQHLLSVCLFISVQHVLKSSFELVLGFVVCSCPSIRPICSLSGHLIMSLFETLLSLDIIWIHCQSSCIYHPFSFIWTLDLFLNDNICDKCLVESVSRFCKQAVFMRLADYFCRYKLCKEINGINATVLIIWIHIPTSSLTHHSLLYNFNLCDVDAVSQRLSVHNSGCTCASSLLLSGSSFANMKPS